MKWTLLMIIMGMAMSHARAQLYVEQIEAGSTVNIPADAIDKKFIPPQAPSGRLKSALTEETEILVTYVDFPEEAKQAFKYAVSLWKKLITTDTPIRIRAEWTTFDRTVLALSRASALYANFDGAHVKNTYYPVALAERLSGKEMNRGEPDMICRFSRDYPWYFGTDGNTPVDSYDFVTAVMHEITHGLGFIGFLADEEGMGAFSNKSGFPSIYDYYIFNHQNQQISDQTIFNRPSRELHEQLTSDKLKSFHPEVCSEELSALGHLYAPSVWKPGSSIYHLKRTEGTNKNGLMNACLYKGSAYHHPGEATLRILEELGWGLPVFQFDELKDLEGPCAAVPVKIGITDNIHDYSYDVKMYFSSNNFETTDSILLREEDDAGWFSGEMPVTAHSGRIQYYFKARTKEGRTFSWPGIAPDNKFNLRIGTDYFSPDVWHNPVKMIPHNDATVRFTARAKDNVGISSVKVEYKLNGIEQEPLLLTHVEGQLYKGTLKLPGLSQSDQLEYRVTAEDQSARKNRKSLPAEGYYAVDIFYPYEPVTGYVNDFENDPGDFALAGFDINHPPGFSGKALRTPNPYPVSEIENEKMDLTAQLKYPVILQENGTMTFDEIVLVEPGDEGYDFNDRFFRDYVIVEGSKDGGSSWKPLSEGYDSAEENQWLSAFSNNLKSGASQTTAQASMFMKHTLNLTENPDFMAGDTIIIRFRLASDEAVSGWGWMIDNIDIQGLNTSSQPALADHSLQVYPNPCTNSFYVDCTDFNASASVDITVTDLHGKTIVRERDIDPLFAPKTKIDLSSYSQGIYLVHITDGAAQISTKKIIKQTW